VRSTFEGHRVSAVLKKKKQKQETGRVKAGKRLRRTPKRAAVQLQKTNAPSTLNLEQLELGLKRANAQLKESSRGAAITALEAVMAFIHSVPALRGRNLGASIWALRAALEDLDHGRVAAILAPAQVDSRRPDPSMRKVAKAYASCCVDILRREGSSIPEACRLVAKELKGAGFALGSRRSTPDWQTVKSWRDRVTKLPPTDPERETLEGLRKEISRLKFHSVEDAKNFVVEQLQEIFQKMGRPALE
jgi:hypothetical protein